MTQKENTLTDDEWLDSLEKHEQKSPEDKEWDLLDKRINGHESDDD